MIISRGSVGFVGMGDERVIFNLFQRGLHSWRLIRRKDFNGCHNKVKRVGRSGGGRGEGSPPGNYMAVGAI